MASLSLRFKNWTVCLAKIVYGPAASAGCNLLISDISDIKMACQANFNSVLEKITADQAPAVKYLLDGEQYTEIYYKSLFTTFF